MNWRKTLFMVLICEVTAGFCFVGYRATQQPAPPTPDLQKLDPLTAETLVNLQKAADGGGAPEWRELAEAYLGNGYYAEAEYCFRHAWKLNSSDLQALYGQGFCLERVGKTAEAIGILEQVAVTAPAQLRTTCWYQIGRCFLRQEDSENAAAAFRRIPEFPPAAYQLARLLSRSEHPAEAIPILERQLEQLPNSLKLIQLRRYVAEAMDDSELAAQLQDREERAEYQLSLEYGQSFITMFAGRYGIQRLLSKAVEFKSSGTLEQRKAVFDEVLGIIRDNQLWQYRPVFLAAAHVEFGLGNLEEVEKLIAEIRRHSQDGADLLELEGMVLAKYGRVDDAVSVWKRAVAMSPTISVINEILKSESVSEDEARGFRAAAKMITALDTFRSNRPEDARPDLEEAVQLDPSQAGAWYYLGEIERLAGAIDKAAVAYSKCLELDPTHGRARRRQAL